MSIKIESNYDYLPDASVVNAEVEGLRVGSPQLNMARCPAGKWMTATKNFHLRGGWGGGGSSAWVDHGANVRAGQRFRLVSYGTAATAAVWEVNDGGATKKESRSRAWLVDAQCRAVLRRDWKAERAYEARILALDEAAAKQ